MLKQHEIAQFRTNDGRLLFGRISSISAKKITLICPGLGTSHRCNPENVCRVISQDMTIQKIMEWNIGAYDRLKENVIREKERKAKMQKLKAIRKEWFECHGPLTRYDIADRISN